MHLRKTLWQSGSSSSWHCMDNHDAGPLQCVHTQAGKTYAYHVTAADRLESLPPRETSSFTDATMEGSRPAGSSGRFHHRIWPGDPRRANLSKHL